MQNAQKFLVEIYADLKLKDSIVDELFEQGFDDFYFFECYQYATTSLLLSEKEQVSGRKDYSLFRLYLDREVAKSLTQKIKNTFGKDVQIFHFSSCLIE